MKYTIVPNELRIAISGKSGCGNTSITKQLSEKLNITMINFTFRNLTTQYNLTLEEIIQEAKTNDFYDITVDKNQVALAQAEKYCVLGSRLAIWMLKNADFTVYLEARPQTRANRIFTREGGDFQKIYDFTVLRDTEDSLRYQKLYTIDNNCYDFANLIIDTAQYTINEIVEIILRSLEQKHFIKNATL